MKLTEGKLKEAKFFLAELERAYYEFIHAMGDDEPAPPTAQYYLSAFISSARSVMWVMRYEYHEVSGWEAWYDSRKANRDREEIEILNKINAVRIRSEKQSPLTLGVNIAFNSVSDDLVLNVDEKLPKEHRKQFNMTIRKVPEEGEVPDEEAKVIETLVEVRSFFLALEEFPKEDVLGVCKSYLGFLEAMVSDCKERFG